MTMTREKVLVGPLLDNPPVRQEKNDVGILYGR